ncbi:MAG TPA: hypothetical protein VGQ83_19760 [Polyangia bacterium]|jgi:hypothetical protein
MTHETIGAIIGELPAVRREGEAYLLAADHEATFFVGAAGGMLPVGKIHRIELRKEFLLLETLKRERFYFDYADVVGMKIDLPEPGKQSHGAGFR